MRWISAFLIATVAGLSLAACGTAHETDQAMPQDLVGKVSIANLIVDAERPAPGKTPYITLTPGLSGSVTDALRRRFDRYPQDGEPLDVAVILTDQTYFEANDTPTVSGSHGLRGLLEIRKAGSEEILGLYTIDTGHSTFGPMMLTQSESSAQRHRKAVDEFAEEIHLILSLTGFGT